MNIIKGKKSLQEALKSNHTQIDRILVAYPQKNKPEIISILNQAKNKNIKIQFVSSEKIAETTAETQNQGIVAYIQIAKTIDLQSILQNPQKHPYILIADHLEDPYNFGAIIRTCEVLGFSAVIYPKDRNCQLTPGVSKTSSGAIHHIEMIKVTNLASTLKKLKNAGYWLYGADSNQGQNLADCRVNLPLALIVGNEKKGISPVIQKKLDCKIHIPQKGKVSSLNVSVATGIIIYHLTKTTC